MDNLIKEYEEALQAEARANFALELSRIPVKVIAKRIELELRNGIQNQPKEQAKVQLPTRLEKFMKEHGAKLEDWDIEFLQQESRPAGEVADYLDKHRNHPADALKKGIYRPGRGDSSRKRMIDTISVVMHQLNLA
jgi:hypothetical protein